jgi:hypothetical protein
MRPPGRSAADFPRDNTEPTGQAGQRRRDDLAERLARLPEGHPSGYADTDLDECESDAPADLDVDPDDPDLAEEPAEQDPAEQGEERAARWARPPGRPSGRGHGWSEPAHRDPYRPWFSGDAAADPWFTDGPEA